jgi:hypothetical protein
VISLIGAMFAPRPNLVAAEPTRVCRPGGLIAMANWTPAGFVGQMFKTIAVHRSLRHAIARAVGMSPSRVRLRERIADLRCASRVYHFEYLFPPNAVVEFFRLLWPDVARVRLAR